MGIKQHLMTLAGVGHQPEGATGAQLHVRDLHAVVDSTDHHTFFAPVKLEGFAQIELQWHEGLDVFASAAAPGTDEIGDSGVATGITAGFDLRKQCACCTPVLFGSQSVGFEGKLELVCKGAQFAKALSPNILGYLDFLGGLESFLQGVARQPCAFCYCPYRHLVAYMHAPYLA